MQALIQSITARLKETTHMNSRRECMQFPIAENITPKYLDVCHIVIVCGCKGLGVV